MDNEHSDGISVISETSTHRALDELWDHCEETLSLSPQKPSQKFTSTNVVLIGGIVAFVSMIIANFVCMEGIEMLTPIAHNDNTTLLAQRVDLLELENEALRILVDKLMRDSDKQHQSQLKESLDRKTKKIKVWTGDGNSVEKAYIEKNKKSHHTIDYCNNIVLNSDDLYSEYRKNQCELKKLNGNKHKTESESDSKTVPAKSKYDKRAGSSPTPDIKPDSYHQKPPRKIDTYERKDKKEKSNSYKMSKNIDKIAAEENLRTSRKTVKEPYQEKPSTEFKTKHKRDKGSEKWKRNTDFVVKTNTLQPDKHAENIIETKPPKYRSF